MRDSRLTGLDFLRALACLLVFSQHTVQRLDPAALSGGWSAFYRFFIMGGFGVGIFFLLSGFLLARPYWLAYDLGAPMPSLWTYALRRMARIVPGYYASLTVTFVLAATVFGIVPTWGIIARYVLGLLFLSEFHWESFFPVEVNGPLWSVGMEVFSYALLPLGLIALFALRPYLARWRGRIVFVGVVGLALVTHYLTVTLMPKATGAVGFEYGMVGGAKYWMPEFNVFGFFVVFAIGSLTAGLSTLWRGDRKLLADGLVLAGLISAALAIWSVALPTQTEAFGWLGLPYDFPWFQLGIAAALGAFPHTRLLPAVSELAPIRYFAKISFGVYVWHFLILELMRQQVVPHFYYAGISDTTRWMELTAVSFILAVIAGSLSWYGIEAPVLNWAKRREPDRNTSVSLSAPPQKLHA